MKKVVYFSIISLLIIAGLFMTGCMTNEKVLDPDNRAPMINFFDVYPQTIVRNNTVTITVNYTDYDGDVVDFSIVADPERTNPETVAPPIATADPDIFKWFAPKTGGRYWFRATGTDNNFTTESVFSIIVLSRPPNIAWQGTPPLNPLTHKVELALTEKQFKMEVQDDDAPPTSTITVEILVEKQDTSDTYADEYVMEFFDSADTDVITVAGASATIILDTTTRTVAISSKSYYPEGGLKESLLNTGPCPIAPGAWANTLTVTFKFTDESDNSDSIVQVIKLRN
ncbi:hypothetical protein KAU32_06210 [bacterium]|nr:hypothetical protein [bacterium]